MPFTNDLVRLTTSIALAAEMIEIQAPLREICRRVLDGYREGVQAEGRPILVEKGGHPELKQLAAAVTSPSKFWRKHLNRVDNPRIGAADLPARLKDIFRASLPRGTRPTYRKERSPADSVVLDASDSLRLWATARRAICVRQRRSCHRRFIGGKGVRGCFRKLARCSSARSAIHPDLQVHNNR
jgi:hypothetical protein